MSIELYPGMAFSPQAVLADNVGAGDAVVPVSDVSAFPPAPNLATIGGEEGAETIRYAAKTETALSGCVRGVEGEARAWSAGEPIARNWTAKDHNDLIGAVGEAMELAAQPGPQGPQGETGETGPKGDKGDKGDPGPGVPSGGTTGQMLAKASGADYDTRWTDAPAAVTPGQMEEALAAKQDALRGRPGEAVGFGADGATVAVQGWSNPNLLDNWYFADPVNQRGQTEYTAAGYTIDRWRMAIDISKILVEDGGLVVDATSNAVTFYQPFDGMLSWILGKTFTVTIEYTYLSGPVWSELMFNLKGTLNALRTGNLAAETGKRMVRSVTAVIPGSVAGSAPSLSLAWFYAAKGAKVKIHSIKCELGARQTLLHQDADGDWVLNDPPPNKALELAKCQRYQFIPTPNNNGIYCFGIGVATSSTAIDFFVPLPTTMRARSTITLKNIYAFDGSSKLLVTAYSNYGNVGNGVWVHATVDGAIAGRAYYMRSESPFSFIFDANL